MKDRDKKIVVLCGIGFDNPGYDICNSNESLTLELGLDRAKMVERDLVDATTYLAVAGQADSHAQGASPNRRDSDELTAAMPWNDR